MALARLMLGHDSDPSSSDLATDAGCSPTSLTFTSFLIGFQAAPDRLPSHLCIIVSAGILLHAVTFVYLFID